MITLSATVHQLIARPPDDVFAFVGEPANMAVWVNGVSNVRRAGDSPVIVGETFASDYAYAGKTDRVTYEVREFTPPTRVVFASTQGPFPFTIRLDRQPDGNAPRQTRIAATITTGSDSKITSVMFVALRPLVARMMRRQLRQQLQQLCSQLETNG